MGKTHPEFINGKNSAGTKAYLPVKLKSDTITHIRNEEGHSAIILSGQVIQVRNVGKSGQTCHQLKQNAKDQVIKKAKIKKEKIFYTISRIIKFIIYELITVHMLMWKTKI